MTYSRSVAALLSMSLAVSLASAQAKKGVVAFTADPPGQRLTVGILFFDQDKQRSVGNVNVSFGQPVWKPEYEDTAKFDAETKGKVWRLGKDFWTTMDNNLPLRVGGTQIPAGYWYLGLHRSEDGARWSLAVMDPAKARKTYAIPAGLPFGQGPAPDILAPLEVRKTSSLVEKLMIQVTRAGEDLTKATLRIHWGRMELVGPIELQPGK